MSELYRRVARTITPYTDHSALLQVSVVPHTFVEKVTKMYLAIPETLVPSESFYFQ